MSDYVRTYVTSMTYDTLKDVMYPDLEEVERTVEEVERLILQGHTVEYRFGDNRSVILDIDKFNTFVKPHFPTTDEILQRQAKEQEELKQSNPLLLNEGLVVGLTEPKKTFTINESDTKSPVEQLMEQGATREEIIAFGFNPDEALFSVTPENTSSEEVVSPQNISGGTSQPLDLGMFLNQQGNSSTPTPVEENSNGEEEKTTEEQSKGKKNKKENKGGKE